MPARRVLPTAVLRACALLTGLAAARVAGAQAWQPSAADTVCVRPTPASALTRVPVFLAGEVVDSADSAARPAVDLVAQEVAARVRAIAWVAAGRDASLADTATRLPAGDALVGGLDPRGVRVVVRRDVGAVAWGPIPRERGGSADSSAADSARAAVLVRALGPDPRAVVFVPNDVIRGDSLAFDLDFARPEVWGAARAVQPLQRRNPAPVFTRAVPWELHAAAVPGTLRPEYPAVAWQQGGTGKIFAEFVVGADGRAAPGTVRDLWLGPNPRPTGKALKIYEAFLEATRNAVHRARFLPARVAGCPVPELVQLPVGFTIGRP